MLRSSRLALKSVLSNKQFFMKCSSEKTIARRDHDKVPLGRDQELSQLRFDEIRTAKLLVGATRRGESPTLESRKYAALLKRVAIGSRNEC